MKSGLRMALGWLMWLGTGTFAVTEGYVHLRPVPLPEPQGNFAATAGSDRELLPSRAGGVPGNTGDVRGRSEQPVGSNTVSPPIALGRQLAARSRTVDVAVSQPVWLQLGDPVFYVDGSGNRRLIGQAVGGVMRRSTAGTSAAGSDAGNPADVFSPGIAPTVPRFWQQWRIERIERELIAVDTVRLDIRAPAADVPFDTDDSSTVLTYCAVDDSLAWVVEELLPPDRRRRLAEELTTAYRTHHEEILEALRPIVRAALADAVRVVEADAPAVFERHQSEVAALAERYQRTLIEQRLVPLVRTEVWPLLQRDAEPLVTEVAREIWQRVSVWRFAWRYLYDAAPLPERNRFEAEWQRFLHKDVRPILESHTDDFVSLLQHVIAETARKPDVQQAARESVREIWQDEQLQRLAFQFVQELVIENPKLHAALRRHWTSPEARQALELAADKLEPVAQRIGRSLFGSLEEGITPEFAAVLRRRVLQKDRRWFELRSAGNVPEPDPSIRRIPVRVVAASGRRP